METIIITIFAISFCICMMVVCKYKKNSMPETQKTEEKTKPISLKTPAKCTKLLFFSDTHGCMHNLTEVLYVQEKYDAVFCLGDIAYSELNEIKNNVHCPLYMITGNHDSKDMAQLIGIPDLNGEKVNINGLEIVGWSGSIKYKNSDNSMMTDEESVVFAENLPDADILLSHDVPKKATGDLAHSGLEGITRYIDTHHIALHIHGHIHSVEDIILPNGTRSISIFQCGKITIEENGDVIFTDLSPFSSNDREYDAIRKKENIIILGETKTGKSKATCKIYDSQDGKCKKNKTDL